MLNKLNKQVHYASSINFSFTVYFDHNLRRPWLLSVWRIFLYGLYFLDSIQLIDISRITVATILLQML